MFAPFWSDNDIRKEGTVRYLAMSRGQNERHDEIMDRVIESIINDKTIQLPAGYVGSWALVAQWDKVHPYPHGAQNHLGISEEFLSLVSLFPTVCTSGVYLLFKKTGSNSFY